MEYSFAGGIIISMILMESSYMTENKYNIMIVEDDNTIAEKIKSHLEKWAYNVYIAKDFGNVLKEVSDFQPDLILLDITLPYFNGFYWCGEIRKMFKIPIIFISSADDSMNIVMARIWAETISYQNPLTLRYLLPKYRLLSEEATLMQVSLIP